MEEWSDDGSYSDDGFNIAGIFRHWFLLLVCLSAGLYAGYRYYQMQDPVYSSGSRFIVTRIAPRIQVEGTVEEEKQAQMLGNLVETLQSREFLGKTVNEFNLGDLIPAFNGLSERQIVSQIGKGLFARTVFGSDVIEVSYQSNSPEQSQVVLTSIVENFERSLSAARRDQASQALDQIESASKILEGQVNDQREAYRQFRKDTELIWSGNGAVNVHRDRLLAFENRQSELTLRLKEAEAKLEGVRDTLASGGSREAALLFLDAVANEDSPSGRPSLSATVAESLFPLIVERETLIEEGVGKDHPRRRSVERRIEMTREHFKEVSGQSDGAGEEVDLIDIYIDSFEQEIALLKTQLQQVEELKFEEAKKAKDLVEAEFRDQSFRDAIAKSTELFDTVVAGLAGMNLASEMEGYEFRLLARPELGSRIPFDKYRIIALGGICGLVVGGIFAFVLEMRDERFRNAQQISRVAGAPVLAHVAKFKKRVRRKLSGVDPSVVSAVNPSSHDAEIYRSIRASLAAIVKSQDSAVLLVTSPNPSDGKSTLSTNLAVAFAGAGKRTLLLDCDLRRPKASKLFDGEKAGVVRVVTGEAEIADAIDSTSVEDLSILRAGRPPHNPAELLASMRFESILSELRSQFDVIIIDSPPVLAVSDASSIAQLADGVVLTLQLTKWSRRQLEAATEKLRQVGATTFGVVVNNANRGRMSKYYDYRSAYGSYSRAYRGYTSENAHQADTKAVVRT